MTITLSANLVLAEVKEHQVERGWPIYTVDKTLEIFVTGMHYETVVCF